MKATIEQIAKVCHEVNRGICLAAGDTSQQPWDQAEQWQRDSAVRGVQLIMSNPQIEAAAQHEAWMADKIAEGWIYGPVKDAHARIHPCLVPHDQLPFEQQVKDYAFKAVVEAMS